MPKWMSAIDSSNPTNALGLGAPRQWVTLHNWAVMSVLLLVIGVAIMGRGPAGV